jgi:predicted Zn-dependent protease
MNIYFSIGIFFLLFSIGCSATTDRGAVGVERRQFLLVPAAQLEQDSAAAYSEIKTEAQKRGKLNANTALTTRITNIAHRLIPHTAVFRSDAPLWKWEVNVIESPELNAFCLPGGKIIFYSGIVEKLKMTDAEIAAVMGHEMAHALREHGRERYSQALVQQLILQTGVAMDRISPTTAQLSSALVTYAVLMPFGRNQELESDEIGVELMARAGYAPQAAVSLWKKMESAAGARAPEFLSTHPSGNRRIEQIQALIPKVQPLFEQTRKR